MENLLETFLFSGAAGGIFVLILYGIRALSVDESGSHDPSGLNSTDQDGRNSVSDTTDRKREESKDRESSAVTRSNSRTFKIKCYRCSEQINARAPHCVHCGAPKKKAAATRKKAAPKKKTPVREAARARKKSSALITVCESCGGKISKRLDSCPHCGWSTKPTISCPDCGASFAASLPACPECGGPRA